MNFKVAKKYLLVFVLFVFVFSLSGLALFQAHAFGAGEGDFDVFYYEFEGADFVFRDMSSRKDFSEFSSSLSGFLHWALKDDGLKEPFNFDNILAHIATHGSVHLIAVIDENYQGENGGKNGGENGSNENGDDCNSGNSGSKSDSDPTEKDPSETDNSNVAGGTTTDGTNGGNGTYTNYDDPTQQALRLAAIIIFSIALFLGLAYSIFGGKVKIAIKNANERKLEKRFVESRKQRERDGEV
jgi:hypothetical protein